MRTPGRRYFESHWHIRLAGFIAVCFLATSIWFTYSRVEEIRSPPNPHYSDNQCFICHEPMGSAMKANECFRCHDLRSRALLPNAVEDRAAMIGSNGRCSHPIKQLSASGGASRTATQLCIGCHKSVNGYVIMTNIATKKYVEWDMATTHPIGLMPTEVVFPRTLPLSRRTGAIDCITCHDQHAIDRRLRMLRLYYPGNGHPPDVSPLCNDCHPEGWSPLRMRRSDVIKGKH